jgi:cytochrome c biogenesis protein CcmG/thiol:disulfide interchange protein DsbE
VSDISATIAWTTNEKATSQVEYGTSASFGSSTAMDEILTTSHSVTINGLEGEKTYYFRIKSKDAKKNEAASETNQTFKTMTPVPTGLEVGKRAPDFTVYTIDGDPVTLSRLRGKIVMINFWAIGCSACVAEMPDIEAVYKTWSGPKELKLLAINAGDHPLYIEKFIREEQYTIPMYIDSDHDALSEYQISRIPRTYFIDSQGIIRKIELGRFDNQNQITAALNSLQ